MTVGELLKQLRLERKVSQQILASRVGWTESRISKIEKDISSNVGIKTIEKYLAGLSVPTLYFYKLLYPSE